MLHDCILKVSILGGFSIMYFEFVYMLILPVISTVLICPAFQPGSLLL